jgi:hypothetical protein
MPVIEIYTKPLCPYCIRAKRLFKQKGVEVTEIDIWLSPANKKEMLSAPRAAGPCRRSSSTAAASAAATTSWRSMPRRARPALERRGSRARPANRRHDPLPAALQPRPRLRGLVQEQRRVATRRSQAAHLPDLRRSGSIEKAIMAPAVLLRGEQGPSRRAKATTPSRSATGPAVAARRAKHRRQRRWQPCRNHPAHPAEPGAGPTRQGPDLMRKLKAHVEANFENVGAASPRRRARSTTRKPSRAASTARRAVTR